MRARAAGHPLPDGLARAAAHIDGRDTPLTGSYTWDNDSAILVLLGYNEEAGRASMIVSVNGTSRRGTAFWRQTGGIVSGGIIRQVVNGSTQISLDTRSGWGHVLGAGTAWAC